MRSSSAFSAGERMILCVGMRARRIAIWAFSSLNCALWRGMNEEVVEEDQKQGEGRFHLAALHHGT